LDIYFKNSVGLFREYVAMYRPISETIHRQETDLETFLRRHGNTRFNIQNDVWRTRRRQRTGPPLPLSLQLFLSLQYCCRRLRSRASTYKTVSATYSQRTEMRSFTPTPLIYHRISSPSVSAAV